MPSSSGRSPHHGMASRRRAHALRNNMLAIDASSTNPNSTQDGTNLNSTRSYGQPANNGFEDSQSSSIFSPDFNAAASPRLSPHPPPQQPRLSFGSTNDTRKKTSRQSWGGKSQHQSRIRDSTGSILATGLPPPEGIDHSLDREKDNKRNDVRSASERKQGDPQAKLRILISSCLHSTSSITTASTASAVFYASILYTQTKSPHDAYLFASALSANQEKRRAKFTLEKAGLLNFESILYTSPTDGHTEQNLDPLTIFQNEKEHVRLIIESILLAAQCDASFGEWDEVNRLLEDVTLSSILQILPPVEDLNQDVHFSSILENKRQSAEDAYGNTNDIDGIYNEGNFLMDGELELLKLAFYLKSTIEDGDIHPIARLCLMRGKACDEASNPSRAASFLKLALEIDVKCIEAWTYLSHRKLMNSEEEIELVKSLRFEEGDGMEWLQDIFYARLSLGVSEKFSSKKVGAAINDSLTFASPIDASTPMNILPEQASPIMSVDVSALPFQATPSTPFNFHNNRNGGDASSSIKKQFNRKNNDKEFKKQVETSFQSLHFKHNLSQSPYILALAATRAYNAYNLALALHYCQVLYEIDPVSNDHAEIQLATLTALGQKRPLFRFAHALVDADPKSAIAWYAIGCYYYTCGKYDIAQKHFWKATRLDERSATGWVAYGCAFAASDENDQANVCFRHAQTLHSGSHYPMLYMGMEHLRTNNIPVAGSYLKISRSMEKNDPLCCNELGFWAYRNKKWQEAVKWFILALRLYVEADFSEKVTLSWSDHGEKLIENRVNKPRFEFGQSKGRDITSSFSDSDCIDFCQDAFWEPTIFNLGQSYRKLRQFENAKKSFRKCLALCPEKSMSFAALGFTCHLSEELDDAIECYHQALSLKPDDPFSSEMLKRAMEESLDLGPTDLPDNGGMEVIDSHFEESINMGKSSLSQSSIDEDSALSLEESDIDMSMTLS